MRAVTIVSHGGVEGIEIREVPTPPSPTGDQVLVRVRAAALNRADILQRLGRYPAPAGFPQDIPGLEFAGEVEAIGDQVRLWTSGQRVFGIIGGGAQAEFVSTAENQLAEIPANLDWVSAAAVPEAFITADDAVFTQGGLTRLNPDFALRRIDKGPRQTGETLLVHAAASGVGTAAIQLGNAAGARVFGTSRTESKLDRAKQYGLSDAVVIGEDKTVLVDAVHEWTDGRGVDLILDLVGAGYLEANLKALASGGRMMLVGTTSGSRATLDLGLVMSKRLCILGTVMRGRSEEEKASATLLFAEDVVPLLANGRVKPVVDSVYNIYQVREAHARLESNETFGKVVLKLE